MLITLFLFIRTIL